MPLPSTPDEVLSTTRAVRKRLDFDRPVPRSVVEECIDLAFQAPTGSNRQGWSFVIVEDAAKKQAIADLYGKVFDPYITAKKPQYEAGDTRGERQSAVSDSATYLRENFHRSPYLVDWLGLVNVATLESKPGVEPSGAQLAQVAAALAKTPARMIVRAAYHDARPANWLADKSGLPVAVIPFSVGGSDAAKDLVGLYDDTIRRLLAAAGAK